MPTPGLLSSAGRQLASPSSSRKCENGHDALLRAVRMAPGPSPSPLCVNGMPLCPPLAPLPCGSAARALPTLSKAWMHCRGGRIPMLRCPTSASALSSSRPQTPLHTHAPLCLPCMPPPCEVGWWIPWCLACHPRFVCFGVLTRSVLLPQGNPSIHKPWQ